MNCVTTTRKGLLKLSNSSDCQFVVLSNDEYSGLLHSSQLNIDGELYATVSGWILFSFVSGHVLGRILKSLGKG